MKKKVLLYGYFNQNLGDDLFFYDFSRIKSEYECTLLLLGGNNAKSILDQTDIKSVKYPRILMRIDRLLFALFRFPVFLWILARHFDEVVILGGSMFVQHASWKNDYRFYSELQVVKKAIHVVGANFGPYTSPVFIQKYRELFSKFTSVTFRDNYSCNLFLDTMNVHYAPDMILQHPVDEDRIKFEASAKKTMGISVIDPNRKIPADKDGATLYKIFIEKQIKFALSQKLKVVLFSFCTPEGDLDYCEEIASQYLDENLSVVGYKGNIEETLRSFSACDYMIATRFHATMLGWVYCIPTLSIAYSQKTSNVVSDLSSNVSCYSVDQLPEWNGLNEWEALFELPSELSVIKRESQKQLSCV